MILSEIYSEITETIQDTALTSDARKLSLVNMAVQRACRQSLLPELITTTVLTVPAETPGTIEMPDDYHHTLYRALNQTTWNLLNIRTGSKYLSEGFGSSAATVRAYTTDVAVHGLTLYFRPVCAHDQLFELWYYRKPVDLTALDINEEPDGLPDFLHHRLIVAYALKEIFPLIEDGIEGQKVNTMYWNQEYAAGLQELEIYCRKSPRQTPIIRRTARFF